MADTENADNLYSFVLSSVYYARLLPYFLSLCCLSLLFGFTPYLNLYLSGLFYTHLRGSSYALFLAVSFGLIIQQTFSALLHGILQIGASILGAYQSFLLRKHTNVLAHKHMKKVDSIANLDQKAVADLDTIFSYANQLVLSVIGSLCSLVGNFIFLAQFNLLRFTFAFFSFVVANNLLVYLLSSSTSLFSLASLIRTSNNQAAALRDNTRTIEKHRSAFSGLPTKLAWFLESFHLDAKRYTNLSYSKTLYRAAIETSQQVLTRLIHPLVAYLIVHLYQIPFPLSASNISVFQAMGLGTVLQIFKTYTGIWKEGSLCKKNMDTLAKSSSAYRNFSSAYSTLGGKTQALATLLGPQSNPSYHFAVMRSMLVFLVLHRSLASLFYVMEGLSVFYPASTFFTLPAFQLAMFACLTGAFYKLSEPKPSYTTQNLKTRPAVLGLRSGLFARLDIDLASNILGLVVFILTLLTAPTEIASLPCFVSLLAVVMTTVVLVWHENKLGQHNVLHHIKPVQSPVKLRPAATSPSHRILPTLSLQSTQTPDGLNTLTQYAESHATNTPPSAAPLFIKILCRQSDLRGHIVTTPALALRYANGDLYQTTLTPLQTLLYSFLISQPLSLTEHDQTLLNNWPLAEQALLQYLIDPSIHFDVMATGHLAQLKLGNVPEHLSGGQQVKLSCAILFACVTLINSIDHAGIFIGLDEGSGLEGFNSQDQKAVFRPLCSEITKNDRNRFVILTHGSKSHPLDDVFQQYNSRSTHPTNRCSA